MSESIANDLLAALNLVVLQRLDSASFAPIGTSPNWFRAFFPKVPTHYDRSSLERAFPFLENFLVDAEQFWQTQERGMLKSGYWSEMDRQGQELQLEATATCLANQRYLLLIEVANSAYRTEQALIQTGREHQLSHDRFVREVEKKEILLHCIFHDLVGQVTTFSNCLGLLRLEPLSEKGQEWLEIGRKQVDQQTELLREIVYAFSSEVESLEETAVDVRQAPDLWECCRNIVNIFTPSFVTQQKQIQLQPPYSTENWRVIGERSRLERVLANLVENALRHTPVGSIVTLRLQAEADSILCSVDDQGTGVPHESVKFLFQRFFRGQTNAGKVGLGLYFCRITIERWGGAIGYMPLADGGTRFWFRLRRIVPPSPTDAPPS